MRTLLVVGGGGLAGHVPSAGSQANLIWAWGSELAAAGWIGARLVGRRDLAWTVFALVVGVVAFECTLWTTVGKGYPQFPNGWAPPTTSVALGPAGETARGRLR